MTSENRCQQILKIDAKFLTSSKLPLVNESKYEGDVHPDAYSQ